MDWKIALGALREAMTINLSQLEAALQEAEEAIEQNRKEMGFLRSIDAKLVEYAFNPRELFHAIVDGTRAITGASLCDILCPEGDQELLVAWSTEPSIVNARVPMKGSITGEVYTSGKTKSVARVEDESLFYALGPEAQSELAVPLKDQFGGVLGVLNLESDQLNHFTDSHQFMAETISGQAAIGIRNAQLYDQFLAILDTFQLVRSESESVGRILSVVGERARQLVGAEHCQVLTAFQDELIIEFTTGPETPGVTRVKTGDSVSGLAFSRREPVRYEDIRKHPEAKQFYKNILGGMRSELAVPIIWKGQALGVINLESHRVRAFDTHHEKLLTLFASQAAIAIMSAQRSQELVWNQQVQAELWATAQVFDAYGPLIHRLNSDAGAISAALSEIRFKHQSLLAENGGLAKLLERIERKTVQIIEAPARLRRQMERVNTYVETDLSAVINGVVDALGDPPNVMIKKRFAKVPKVWVVPQVEDVVDNLLKNALEAMPHGGKITIGLDKWVTRPKTDRPITNGVEITVEDTCGGIPADRFGKIWQIESAEKTEFRHRHLGFGLWWVKAFVERVGGEISAEPEVSVNNEVGCRFTVRIPIETRRLLPLAAEGTPVRPLQR
jgi:GAF domain-containing protein